MIKDKNPTEKEQKSFEFTLFKNIQNLHFTKKI